MVEKSTMEQEAKNLSERFASVANREEFASKYSIPGKGAQIYQHMHAIRPISLKAAQAYAKAFKCSLAEISPRWAEATASALSITSSETKVQLRPPIIESEEWESLSVAKREFIEMVALGDMSDSEIDAMKSMLQLFRKAAGGMHKPPPRRDPQIIDPTLPEFNEFTDFKDQREQERRVVQIKVEFDRRVKDRRKKDDDETET